VLTQGQREFWEENGYLVLPSHFPAEVMDTVCDHVDDLWTNAGRYGLSTVVDVYLGKPEEARFRLSQAPPDARNYPYKLADLHLESALIRQVMLEPALSRVLAELLGGPPLVCNGLHLGYGSQQAMHTDSLYMPAPDGTRWWRLGSPSRMSCPKPVRCASIPAATRSRRTGSPRE
jgi:hypothetical protein